MTTSTEQGTPTGVPCSISDCTKTAHSRTYCQAHYRRWRKYGDPEHPLQPVGRKRSPDSTDHRKLDPEEKARRAALRAKTRTHCAQGHELSESNTAYAPDGKRSCKICRQNNQARYRGRPITNKPIGPRNRDKTHCPYGHEYTPENTARKLDGSRQCRICRAHVGRKKRYGVSRDDFAALLAQQNGCCAICAVDLLDVRKIHTDHCHTTGVVRGLLCSGCNLMLGHAKDQPDRLRAGAAYLARFREDTATADTAA